MTSTLEVGSQECAVLTSQRQEMEVGVAYVALGGMGAMLAGLGFAAAAAESSPQSSAAPSRYLGSALPTSVSERDHEGAFERTERSEPREQMYV